MIQTPHAGIVLGLGRETGFDLGITTEEDIYGLTDDSYVKPEIGQCESDLLLIVIHVVRAHY